MPEEPEFSCRPRRLLLYLPPDMASPRQSRRFDRRSITRRSRKISALVGRKGALPEACENAIVEDVARGGSGVRLRAATELRPEDSLFLYVGDKPPMAVKVVWAKRDGLLEKRQSGKPGQAFVAGCRLNKIKPRRSFWRGLRIDPTANLPRILFAVFGLGFAGLMIYVLASLFKLMR